MISISKFIVSAAVATLLVGCAAMDPMKERWDGNVVQLVGAQHVKSGRLFNDGSVIGSTNVAQVTGMLGASTSTSLAAGAVMLALNKLLDSTADDQDYYVSVSRPDDTIITIGGPAKMRRNPLGTVRFTPLMEGVRVGDWVKVVKTDQYWTLIPCKLPESDCQEKALQQASVPAGSSAK